MELKERLVKVLEKHVGYLGKKQLPALAEELSKEFVDNTAKQAGQGVKNLSGAATVSEVVTPKGNKVFIAHPNVG